jgi:hypothetical protein
MSLAERHSKTADLTYWQGRIPVNYVYTAGRAGEKFFQAILKGKLVAAKCEGCGCVYLPPRIYCERCFERLEGKEVTLPARGEVQTFTVCHKKLDGNPSDKPIIIAVIRIDDTDGGLVHYLGEVLPEHVFIGMPVQAVFEPKKHRRGTILDVRYFRPQKREKNRLSKKANKTFA